MNPRKAFSTTQFRSKTTKPNRYILAIDQGTTGSRAILYDQSGRLVSSAYQEFRQYYPKPGWVEHDPNEILSSVISVIRRTIRESRVTPAQIEAIGITNQRETVVLWERKTGKPVGRAVVWQDRRSTELCEMFRKKGDEPALRKKTGLLFDPYFSGTKLRWLFDHHASLLRKARSGKLCFGTIDSFLLFQLTGGRVHATDFTNASRTLLFDIQAKVWDRDLCRLFHMPSAALPEPKPSNHLFGKTFRFPCLMDGIPISAMAGDQQAALFGQGCYREGESKNTYGTGCFLLFHLGKKPVFSKSGILTTIACDANGNPAYALEGSVFIAGAAVQWLRDGLHLIRKASETESIALSVRQMDPNLVMVPAFTGLGAPHWRPDVRGAIFGITRGTSRAMLIKATLDSIAFQVREVFDLIVRESGTKISTLKVDGGASRNRYLMQFQADLLGVAVLRSRLSESTAWGAAKLAGLSSGFWPNLRRIDQCVRFDRFQPRMNRRKRQVLISGWRAAVQQLTK